MTDSYSLPPSWKRFNASDYLHSEEEVELFLQIARKEATGAPDALEQIVSALRVAAEARSRMELARRPACTAKPSARPSCPAASPALPP